MDNGNDKIQGSASGGHGQLNRGQVEWWCMCVLVCVLVINLGIPLHARKHQETNNY